MSRYGGDPLRLFGFLAVLSLGIVLVAPNAMPTTVAAVEGHTIFTQLGGYDDCLAAVAGLARSKVMWFNDQILLDSSKLLVGKYVYITQAGAPDPVDQVLMRTGKYFDFVDPNGRLWNVTEYSYGASYASADNRKASVGGQSLPVYLDSRHDASNWFVWTVQIQDVQYDYKNPWVNVDDPNAHEHYNFVIVTDTCKFNDLPGTGAKLPNVTHNSTAERGWGHDTANKTETTQPNHVHESYQVSLWLGDKPREVQRGVVVRESVYTDVGANIGRDSGSYLP